VLAAGMIEIFKSCVLGSEAALAGGIHNEQNVAPELGKAESLPVCTCVQERGRKIIDRFFH
jgi:hypothetical protein